MKSLSKAVTAAKKEITVRRMWVNGVAISWPSGGIGGALHLDEKSHPGIKMKLNSLEGWLLIERNGKKAATNGPVMVELEEDEV